MRTTASQPPSDRKTPKAKLYANLARLGVARVTIAYDGCGGRIPTVADWLSQLKPSPWMSRGYSVTTVDAPGPNREVQS